MLRIRCFARWGALVGLLLSLQGCGVEVRELGQPRVGQSQNFTWPRLPGGGFLCLSSVPGEPVYGAPVYGAQDQEVIGYTRNVVALYGPQAGGNIQILYYDGRLGWIDGMKIRPYDGGGVYSHCAVPGVDLQQRPIFVFQ